IEEGKLSAGQARPLIGHDDAEMFAREIVAKGLSAREAETLTRKPGGAASLKPKSLPKAHKDADTLALEKNISDQLGLTVEISFSGEKGGQVKIAYKTLEQLDEICRRLAGRGAQKMH
ncbi:MAG: chromosome partitioning protein ParB, partial [Parvibaculum sp.]|nr:chromosome partitioning protein ParB [Parvibaculum sp.]